MAWWGVLWKNEIRGFWVVMVGKASKCAQMNTMKVLVQKSFEFDGFCTWSRLSVHQDIARWLGGEFWSKTEIRGFWDVKVGLASKCPQMNTMKVLVHECFEFGGFCTWPSWSVHHDIARWLGGEFCEKLKFVVFEMWWRDWLPNVPKLISWKSWCTKILSSVGFAHGQVGRCATA